MHALSLPVALSFVALLFAAPSLSQETQVVPVVQAPPAVRPANAVEVVFVLDTTGSMGGLIQSAKEKIWGIANMFALAEPTLTVRIGLVGYRDRKDDYITKLTKLSDNLDAVYANLIDLQAGGGGDSPESVNQALNEAVMQGGWSRAMNTYRVIFLVGDCPPHMDYEDDVKYQVTCKIAAELGIIINTIQCGNDKVTTPIWTDIAKKAEGSMFRVDQDGGAVTITTPFDSRLAALSAEIDGTRMWYGNHDEQKAQRSKDRSAGRIYADSSKASQAARCEFNQQTAGTFNWIGTAKELIHDLGKGNLKLADIDENELPEALKKIEVDKRQQHIDQVTEKRRELEKTIKDLLSKRRVFLEQKLAKESKIGKLTWEVALRKCVQEQIGHFGVKLKTNSPGPNAKPSENSDTAPL